MIYLDIGGRGPGLLPAAEAHLPINDRGFLYGDGLFETILLRDGQMPLLPEHLERLRASCLELAISCDLERIREAALAVAARRPEGGEYVVRITVSRGVTERRGFEPPANSQTTVLITSFPYRRPTGPLSAITSSIRVNPTSPISRHKSLSALDHVMARAEAMRAGCDEAVMLGPSGRVAEGAGNNIFLLKGGLWLTPPVADGCLPGVMRRRVIELTQAVEWPVTPEDLRRADGVYLTNAVMGCLPLAALDGRGLPWAERPAFFDQLFQPALGRNR